MKMKEPDCVAMKRRGAQQIYEQTKNMTLDEQLQYWQQRTGELRRRQQQRRNTQRAAKEE